MGKERLPLRVDPETKDALVEYADERDVSNSEAGRRMLRAGLTQNGYNIAAADGVGTVAEIEKLRNDLTQMEQRQVELAEQREQRIKRQWLTTAGIAVLFVAASQLGGAPSGLVASGGVIVLAAVMLSTYRAATLTGDDDE